MESNGTQTAMKTVGADVSDDPRNTSVGADASGGPSDAEKARAFRALIRGEYRAQYAEETQKLINRRFKETEKLRQRVKELEALGTGGDPVGNAVLSVPRGDRGQEDLNPGTAFPTETGGPQRTDEADAPPEAPTDEARRAHGFAAYQSARWQRQALELRARQPDFDLDAMRADPTFALLLMHGVPMEQAWRAATVRDRERAAAEKAERAVTADIRARGARPPEAGTGAAPGFSLRPDVAGMSDGEVREVLARLAGKERISFG